MDTRVYIFAQKITAKVQYLHARFGRAAKKWPLHLLLFSACLRPLSDLAANEWKLFAAAK